MADNFDKDIQALVDNLRKQSSEFEQDFKKIFQQVESLSDTIHSELDTIAKPSKIKKPFKRKISVKKAQTLCQKYKTHQLRHLYKNLRSFALVKLNEKNLLLFWNAINAILSFGLPDELKNYFIILAIPIWFRLFYLTNFSDALGEGKNKQLK